MERWVEGVRQGEWRAWSPRYPQFKRTYIYISHIHRNQVFPLTTSNFSISCALNILLLKRSNWHTGLISWTKPQVQARSHPNMLAATAWLSKLYHVQVADIGNSEKNEQSANTLEGVDLTIPLTYADRFRIRKPGSKWAFDFNPPHVDGTRPTLRTLQSFSHSGYSLGGTIERWEDPFFRKCFQNILNGNWKDHDPFSLEGRLDARSSLYGRPSQSSIFRTFQGWLAMRWFLLTVMVHLNG